MSGLLVFDGWCGFCTRSQRFVTRLDRHRRVRTAPFQQPGIAELVGVPAAELASAAWWLDDDGSRCRGAEAVNAALSAALGTRLPLRLYRLAPVRLLQDAAYRWVTANRYRLPGMTAWCRTHPEACG